MRIAVISDIHGNLDALMQVIHDIDRSDIDATICLGDSIGYGPEPNEVLQLLISRKIPSVSGNHEMVVEYPDKLNQFNPEARRSFEITINMLSEETLCFIRDMERFLIFYGCRFVHGFPPESVSTYLFQMTKNDIRRVLTQTKERLCFVGHTHELEFIGSDGRHLIHLRPGKGIIQLLKYNKYIMSAGSVGQPRDDDNSAKYLIFDSTEDTIEIRYIPYDIEQVVKKIIAAGLPRSNADRLR
ncbi:metallophosphoesterase family protein [Desulfobacterales bacterium HSG16]|nr:metallophosphoesterase family protein [Desulfobacterales bacterium HSG16]